MTRKEYLRLIELAHRINACALDYEDKELSIWAKEIFDMAESVIGQTSPPFQNWQ